MGTKEEARTRVNAAEKDCRQVQSSWSEALKSLEGTVTVNGHGIFTDRYELRDKLERARSQLQTALSAIDAIDWPTIDDYDAVD